MPPSKLLLYPQLLLTCFAMLPTTYMHLYALIIDLLQKVATDLDAPPHETIQFSCFAYVSCIVSETT